MHTLEITQIELIDEQMSQVAHAHIGGMQKCDEEYVISTQLNSPYMTGVVCQWQPRRATFSAVVIRASPPQQQCNPILQEVGKLCRTQQIAL